MQNRGSLDPQAQDRSIAWTLERTRVSLGAEIKTWAHVLGISEKDYQQVRLGRRAISIAALESMATFLNVSLESFGKNDIDTRALVARFRGDETYLREKYAVGAMSSRWSSINVMDYVDSYFGWELRARALKHLQVSEGVFARPDEKINLRFLVDLLAYLQRSGASESHLFAMGANSVVTYLNAPLGKELQKSRGVHEALEAMNANIGKYLEKNFQYALDHLGEDTCVFAAKPNPDLCDALKQRHPGSPGLCLTKAGVLAAIPAYLGLPFAEVVETTCIHRGDDACRFEADLERVLFAYKHRQNPEGMPGHA
jgi:hypothetical protein